MFRRRKRAQADFISELESHIALEAERLRAEGLSDAEAYARARRAFGNITKSEERFYESGRTQWLDHLRQDIGYALRQCGHSKGFATVAIVTLALGIGVNTAIFTLLHAVMFNRLPVYRPAELHRLGRGDNCCVMTGYQNGQDFALFSYDLYNSLHEQTPEIKDLAAFQAAPEILSIRRSGSSEPGRSFKVEYVSANYFDLFGIRPARGAFFGPRSQLRAGAPVAVISYRVWETNYGRDAAAIGSNIWIKGKPFIVVGVAPAPFYGETLRSDPPDFWLPLATEALVDGTNNLFDRREKLWLYVMGRVPPGRRVRELESKINVEAKRWFVALAGSHLSAKDRRDIEDQFIPLTAASGGIGLMSIRYRDALLLLMSLSSLVLLIACANVANLLLARGTALRSQISLRLALGASRGRVTRQALTESLLLSWFGGAAGLALAFATSRLILVLAFRGAHYVPIDASPSWPVLAFAFGVSVATGLLFGIAPAWIQTHSDPADALRGASRSTPAAATLPQKLLVIAQAALSLVLLTGAGLLTESLRHLEQQNFGFRTDHRILVQLDPALGGYTEQRLAGTYRRLQEQLSRIPGVISASLSMYAPMTGNNWVDLIWVEGTGAAPQTRPASYDRVSSGYFDTIGTRLLEGRAIDDRDLPSSRRVAVVNRTFADLYFKDRNPIGKRFGLEGPEHAADYEIAGIVEDAKYNSTYQPAYPTFFLPLLQMEKKADGSLSGDNFIGSIELHVGGNTDQLEALVRRTVEQVDANLAVMGVTSYGQQLSLWFNQERLIATLTQLFGLLALILASVGLYGLVTLGVARRTAEIGVRIALGASREKIVALVLRGAILQVILGVAIGLPLTLAGARLIQHQLFGIRSYDPLTQGAAIILLAACATAAALVPARRAARVDPMLALRVE
ncbi:MAG TPA: ABC transporter permease [Bryobacteraceae bacterium]|jgi:predicted permease|nr:ABC transporter permease [Bryobacteraceae bacterium]